MARGDELRRRGRLERNCTSWNPFGCVFNLLSLLIVDDFCCSLYLECICRIFFIGHVSYSKDIIDLRTFWRRSAIPGLLVNARRSCRPSCGCLCTPLTWENISSFSDRSSCPTREIWRVHASARMWCSCRQWCSSPPVCSSFSVFPRVTLICSCAFGEKIYNDDDMLHNMSVTDFHLCDTSCLSSCFSRVRDRLSRSHFVTIAIADEMSAAMLSCDESSQIS